MPEAPAQDPELVSVILVNWNRLADVRLALAYLKKTHYPSLEVIVVDNGSTDGSLEEFRKTPGIRLIELGRNAGPCIARNVGIKSASGKYLFFLDSDAVLSKRALAPLVDAMPRSTAREKGSGSEPTPFRRPALWRVGQRWKRSADSTSASLFITRRSTFRSS